MKVGFSAFRARFDLVQEGVWVDRRHTIFWCFYFGVLVWVVGTVFLIFSLFTIYNEDFGERIARKMAMMALFSTIILIGIYYCIGFFQLLFKERREKFVAWRVRYDGLRFYVDGFFWKEVIFGRKDIAAVEVFNVKTSIRQIATLLEWKFPNYRLDLKDGRKLYFSGDMDKDKNLLELFQSCAS